MLRQMIERTERDDILTLRLAHGKASAMDVELVEAISAEMTLAAAGPARAVIVTGTGSIFSAGVDLFRMLEGGAEYVQRFVPSLTRMLLDVFSFPKPLVAAVNGHAIAGGCILALAADVKLMAAGNGRIGVPELLVGVPFPPAILEAVRFALPPQHLQALIYGGRTVPSEDAVRFGFVDEAVEPAQLEERAFAVASQLAAIPAESFRLTKRQLRDAALHRARRYENELGGDSTKVWGDPAVHAHIRAYLERTVKK